MQKRASYHTTLKELVYHDLLPEKYLGSIHRSNLHRWKNDDQRRYIGSDINEIAVKHGEAIKSATYFPKMFYAYTKLVDTLITITARVDNYKLVIRAAKSEIVDAIVKSKEAIPIKSAIKIFNISRSTFHTWVADVKLQCEKSYFKKCNRIYSTQITSEEVLAVKKVLQNPKTRHWPIKSVFFKAIREKTVSVSLGTFYRINKVENIRKTNKRYKKRRHKKGVRAKRPNQIWHTDITVVKSLDGKKSYVYMVIDNYSRKLLAYAIEASVSGNVTARILKEACEKAKLVTSNLNIDLIVDGGPENNNIHVHSFIAQTEINLTKLIALKDISSSNSMIERVNRTLKYRYLFPREIRDFKHLKRTFKYFMNDYNNIRPHGMLNGLTPDEAWSGVKPRKKQQSRFLEEARKSRLKYNRLNICEKCR